MTTKQMKLMLSRLIPFTLMLLMLFGCSQSSDNTDDTTVESNMTSDAAAVQSVVVDDVYQTPRDTVNN